MHATPPYVRGGVMVLVAAAFFADAATSAKGQDVRDRESDSGARGYFNRPEILPANPWRLGVQVRNLETGVLLTNVAPGSPADNAGLRQGDSIVAVGGYQVGYVDGRLYDMGDEIARRVNGRGEVLLLVSGGGRLGNVRAQLSTPQGRIRVLGSVDAAVPIAIRPQTNVTIRVRDVTHGQWSDVVVARHVAPTGGRFPVAFAFEVDPSAVQAGHRYAIDAQLIEPGGQLTSDPVAVGALQGDVRARITLGQSRPPINPGEWYSTHLGRQATPSELSAWQDAVERGATPEEIQGQILGSSEALDRRQGNIRDVVRDAMQSAGVNQPDPAEVDRYSQQLQRGDGSRGVVMQRLLEEMKRRRQPNP